MQRYWTNCFLEQQRVIYKYFEFAEVAVIVAGVQF